MSQHPAIVAGRAVVITGGASGIGLAAAKRFAAMAMPVLIADCHIEALNSAREQINAVAPGARVDVAAVDVSDFTQVTALKDQAYAAFGDVALVMNNAGVGGGGGPMDNLDGWRKVLNVNLMGVLHGVEAFGPAMVNSGRSSLIVNTGSKQGITSPPGDTAYNVSKAGIKMLTENLQHTLRNIPGCQVSAHLLVPGSTFTGMTSRGRAEKPAGSWLPEQVIDFMLERLAAGDFYILCPDNEVTREMDNARMEWAMADLIENRPPLSRWHPDYKDAFAAFLAERTGRHG
jgi:NAD(P)-dependent dehydrogenase (short-subunit alcohol dehydrogenase family)